MNLNKIAKFFRDYSLARFLLPLGVILIIFGCIAYGPVVARQSYPQTEAVVTRSELEQEAYTENGTEHEATYRVFVQYSVDGQEYEEEYGIFPEIVAGSKLTINYNPKDPRDIGQPNTVLFPIAVIAAGVVSLIACAISIIRTRRKNEGLKHQEEEWKHGN